MTKMSAEMKYKLYIQRKRKRTFWAIKYIGRRKEEGKSDI